MKIVVALALLIAATYVSAQSTDSQETAAQGTTAQGTAEAWHGSTREDSNTNNPANPGPTTNEPSGAADFKYSFSLTASCVVALLVAAVAN
jgi:opacity protein-like surface antigen